jgi:hypothetical protein
MLLSWCRIRHQPHIIDNPRHKAYFHQLYPTLMIYQAHQLHQKDGRNQITKTLTQAQQD